MHLLASVSVCLPLLVHCFRLASFGKNSHPCLQTCLMISIFFLSLITPLWLRLPQLPQLWPIFLFSLNSWPLMCQMLNLRILTCSFYQTHYSQIHLAVKRHLHPHIHSLPSQTSQATAMFPPMQSRLLVWANLPRKNAFSQSKGGVLSHWSQSTPQHCSGSESMGLRIWRDN